MKRLITSALLIISVATFAQKDPAATEILDKFSRKALSAASVQMQFRLRINDKVEQTEQESEGQVVIMNNMYRLELPDNIIWYNGSATWTLAPEVREVTVTIPDPEDDTFLTSPSSLFDMYKEGFKYKLAEKSSNGSIIELYPEDPSITEFSIIRLRIGNDYGLKSAEYHRKDGIDLYVDVLDYKLDQKYKSDYFTFNSSEYPDVDIIDMR